MAERIVTIFGSGTAVSGSEEYKLAEQLGRLLAKAGFTIVNGGYGGTMLAAAKGAVSEGGKTIGVTCRAFQAGRPNEFVTEEIETNTLVERLETLVSSGEGYIVLPGSTGTLLELAFVWELKNKGFMNTGKPVILLGDFWNPLVKLIADYEKQSGLRLSRTQTPEQAVELLKTKLG
jgi:uncharacterized protein (TIGR00725 family)